MRAIVFDLDGTLLHFTREYEAVLADAFEAAAGTVHDEWLETYERTFDDLFDACAPDPVRRAFAAVIRAGPSPGDASPDALVDALREREVAMCRPPAGAAGDLARLAEDHALGVLTNGPAAWQRHKLRANGLHEHFDAVVVSYEVGAHKPATEPFRLLEERLPADAYAMVGDDDVDVDGARAAGWAAHRYDGGGFGGLPGEIEWE